MTEAPPEAPPVDVSPEEGDPAPPSPLRLLFQFFVVPLGIVGACVLVFLLFGAVTVERKTPEELLSAVRSSADSTRRWQAAFQLSRSIDAVKDEEERARLAAAALAQFERSAGSDSDDERKVRRYLVLVLGKLGSPGSVPALSAAVGDPDDETRVYAVWALGEIGDPAGGEAVLAASRSEDRSLRKIAAHALSRFDGAAATERLAELEEDAVADVRWNAAISLAARKDPRSLPLLRQMIDRKTVEAETGIHADQVESAMTAAIAGIATLGDAPSKPVLERLAADDTSLKVRDAARKALDALAEAAASGPVAR